MGQFNQAGAASSIRSPRSIGLSGGDSNVQSTTINASELGPSGMPLLSPYNGSGNWGSMMNTPMVSNFPQNSGNQANIIAEATAAKLNAMSTVNNRFQLDNDVRKFRRARSTDGHQQPLSPGLSGLVSPGLNGLTAQQMATLQAHQMQALQASRSRPNSPGIAIQGAGPSSMNFAGTQNNGFLSAYDGNASMLGTGVSTLGMGQFSALGNEGYLSDASEIQRGRSPRGRRGNSRPPEDPTDIELLKDIPAWLRSLGCTTGSSAAYFLSQFSREQSLDLNLTIFERNSYIGGRSTTVYAYDEPSEPVELGASVYVQVNKILVKAAQDLNLTVSSNDASTQRETLGIWNGQGFVWTQATSGQAWFEDYWNLVRLFWRYGSAPKKAMGLMLTVVNRFLEIYEAPHFPFASLSDAALALNLTGVTALTSLQHCLQHGIGERFVTEIIQAATRVNYAQNVASIHGLEGMVSLAANGAMSVEAGNWQIFARMLEQSRAHLLLDTAARSISWDESSHKFNISYTSAKMSASAPANEQFDEVIIAAPFTKPGLTSIRRLERSRTMFHT
ncbi:hypothetical protein L7F22_044553 [Adiantum nelumboides]|nr:hypothetical protein [Adiantum nelumboides]